MCNHNGVIQFVNFLKKKQNNFFLLIITLYLEYYSVVYTYESEEPGDLNLNRDEVVLVTKKDGDWWTGVIGDRSGIFPSNYVQYLEIQVNFTFDSTIFLKPCKYS